VVLFPLKVIGDLILGCININKVVVKDLLKIVKKRLIKYGWLNCSLLRIVLWILSIKNA